MTTEFLSVTGSVVQAAFLSSIDIIPHYLESPVLEKLADKDVHLLDCPSASSCLSAASAAVSSEKRTFTLIHNPDSVVMAEASSMKLPFVCAIISDQDVFLSMRDTGAVLILAENNQDLLDSIVRAYRLCEDNKILLPCVIGFDGPEDFSEPVDIPSDQSIKKFLPQLKIPHKLGTKGWESQKDAIKNREKSMENVFRIAPEIDAAWKKKFNRSWPAVEQYKTEDADFVLITAGYHSSTAKAAIDTLREQGKKVGIARLRLIRPFPSAALKGLEGKKTGVLDTSFIPGFGGVLHAEVSRFLPSTSVIQTRYLTEKDVTAAFSHLEKDNDQKDVPVWL